jgi:hypothetical protein
MSDLYAHASRPSLIAKRDQLVQVLTNLGCVQYRFDALSGDEQIALTDAMLAVSADLREVRAAIAEIDRTIRPLVPEIEDVTVDPLTATLAQVTRFAPKPSPEEDAIADAAMRSYQDGDYLILASSRNS